MGVDNYLGFISEGRKSKFLKNMDTVELEPHDQVIQSNGCTCTNKEHWLSCEKVNVVVDLKGKGRKKISRYVVEMAFCKECGAYYIPMENYAVLTEEGDMIHPVKGGSILFEYLKSGEAFEEEEKHLKKVETRLMQDYKSLQPTVSRYAIDDGCGGLIDISRAKYMSERIYKMQDKLSQEISQPYIGRIDVSNDGSGKETYYIGGAQDKTVGGVFVHSGWSQIGQLFTRVSEPEGIINQSKKQVDLRRKIDIYHGVLHGIEDVFSSNSEYADKGIYDKFLIQVLLSRKKSHQLTDIIATIQEKQYEIIEKANIADIIVQGCAGSGKTMVMLHRLSFWLYNDKALKPKHIKIITPNENFNVHISGLHTQLNLDEIETLSVDQYYKHLLKRYDSKFAATNHLEDEDTLNENFLNYIYSKSFFKRFNKMYKEVISDYALENEFIVAESCAEKCGLKFRKGKSWSDAKKVTELVDILPQIKAKNETELFKIERSKNKIDKLSNDLNKNLQLIHDDEKSLLTFKNNYKEELNSMVDSSVIELEKFIHLVQSFSDQYDGKISPGIQEQYDISVNQLREVENLRKDISKMNTCDEAIDRIKANVFLRKAPILNGFMLDYSRKQNNVDELTKKDKRIMRDLNKAEEELPESVVALTEEEKKEIDSLCNKYEKNTVFNIFNKVFNETISEKLLELDIQRPDKVYRFELYARLLFAAKFWNKYVGKDELLCIDEGQDISICEYDLLLAQNKANDVHFNVYGDLNQRIKKGRGLKTWEHLKKNLLATEYLLNENYRNTNQITEYCNQVFNYDMTLTGVDGDPVHDITFSAMLEELLKTAYTEERKAIILPRTISKQKVTRAAKLSSIKDKISSKYENNKIAVMYVTEVKGMEFDEVYVLDQDMSNNERYIAFTRALTKLTIVHLEG